MARMPYIDPLESSTAQYKLLAWEGPRRMLEWRLAAGESDTLHSHQESLLYFIKGGKMRLHERKADSRDVEVADGDTMAYDPWTGRVENIGGTDIHAILFEVQSVRSSAGG